MERLLYLDWRKIEVNLIYISIVMVVSSGPQNYRFCEVLSSHPKNERFFRTILIELFQPLLNCYVNNKG